MPPPVYIAHNVILTITLTRQQCTVTIITLHTQGRGKPFCLSLQINTTPMGTQCGTIVSTGTTGCGNILKTDLQIMFGLLHGHEQVPSNQNNRNQYHQGHTHSQLPTKICCACWALKESKSIFKSSQNLEFQIIVSSFSSCLPRVAKFATDFSMACVYKRAMCGLPPMPLPAAETPN